MRAGAGSPGLAVTTGRVDKGGADLAGEHQTTSAVPNVEFKRKARLSRQEVADRLIALGELSSGGDTLKIGVASQVDWELEIEIDGQETEIEVELKWTDDPKSNDDHDTADPDTEPDSDPASPPDQQAPAHRGRRRASSAT